MRNILKNNRAILVLIVLVISNACSSGYMKDIQMQEHRIIPKPMSISSGVGAYSIHSGTIIVFDQTDDELTRLAHLLNDRISLSTGVTYPMKDRGKGIHLRINNQLNDLGEEGYQLSVDKNGVLIESESSKGIFYGINTFFQLLPSNIYKENGYKNKKLAVRHVKISDKPRFQWRGVLLDPARYFVPKEMVLRWIDMIAFHKLNMLHWHLTDAQGWRVPIDKYPKLTEDTQNYYSKDDIREIVAYASKRNITIVPEIEMPGHSHYATPRMPELACDGVSWSGTYCVGKESTFQFLEGVLSEVMELFPSEYIHIGGDEVDYSFWKACPDCQKRIREENLRDERELQVYFTKRIENFIVANKRRMIGWEEISEGDLHKSSTVMGWLGITAGIEAANEGYDVVMAPLTYLYLDYYQGRHELEPQAWDVYLNSLKKVYQFEPIPVELTEENRKYIIGVNAPLWQYLFHSKEETEHMLLPRLSAVSEIGWSVKEEKEWGDFCKRVEIQFDRYKALGYNYAESSMTPRLKTDYKPYWEQLEVELDTELGLPVYYTLDGSEPTIHSRIFKEPIALTKTTTIKALCFRNNEKVGYPLVVEKLMNKASRGKIISISEYEKEQAGGHADALIDNVLASKQGGKRNKDSRLWQGFKNRDLEVIIELEKNEEISFLDIRFLQSGYPTNSVLPLYVQYAVSEDGVTFKKVGRIDQEPIANRDAIIRHFKVEIEPVKSKYIKIFAKFNPDTNHLNGGDSWLYTDEIIID